MKQLKHRHIEKGYGIVYILDNVGILDYDKWFDIWYDIAYVNLKTQSMPIRWEGTDRHMTPRATRFVVIDITVNQ